MMLEVEGLRAGYREIEVLHGIDLAVNASEIVALIGANGAGKTTLAKTLAGLLPARAGRIALEGAAVEPPPAIAPDFARHVPCTGRPADRRRP